MTVLTGVEAAVGVVLIFFLPGYAVTKALFPEWRVKGPDARLRAIEIFTLAFVLSVTFTVLVGYVLLVASPGGFHAYWSSPVLEVALAAISAVGLIVAWQRGGFSREAPAKPSTATEEGEEGAWEVLSELDRLAREERRILHALRRSAPDAPERARLNAELAEVHGEQAALQARREAQYAR